MDPRGSTTTEPPTYDYLRIYPSAANSRGDKMSETCICNQFVNIPRLSLFLRLILCPARCGVSQQGNTFNSTMLTLITVYTLPFVHVTLWDPRRHFARSSSTPFPRGCLDEMVRETLRQGQQAAELARSSLTRLIPAAQSARYLQYQSAASAQPSHP